MGRDHQALSCLRSGSGRTLEKILSGLLLGHLLLPFLPLCGQQGTGAHAAIRGFALPEYRKKDNRLQFILYGDRARNLGAMVDLEKLTLDIVRDNVKHINSVIPMNEVPFYPLPSPQEKVEGFWRKAPHCQAVIRTDRAQYDKNARVIRGDGPIHFRSRQIDMEGVGFDAFYKTRLIHVRSRVKVVLRPFWRENAPENQTNQKKDERNKK